MKTTATNTFAGTSAPELTAVRSSRITSAIDESVTKRFTPHPFEHSVNAANLRPLLAHYLAMSEAFPYLQAGAQRPWIEDAIRSNRGIAPDKQVTAAVANFLTSDETGVNYVLANFGMQGLPKILDTDDHFHSGLLKADLTTLFNEPVDPDYSDPTSAYLLELLTTLSDLDPVARVAAMVAFERHAGTMIDALWQSIGKLRPDISKDSLEYFRVHVGGDDPAEAYHVAMTSRMIERCVPDDRADDFVEQVIRSYALHFSWCESICRTQ